MTKSKTARLTFVFCMALAISSSAQTFSTLVNFDEINGAQPRSTLVIGVDGMFYGTTVGGGLANSGTFFKMTTDGALTVLYNFCSSNACTDGSYPATGAGLVQAAGSEFYGTTTGGGTVNRGTIFKITTSGALTTLHSFSGPDGAQPYAGLVQATDGNLYGTTYFGGAEGNYGTVFKITPAGEFTTLYSFDGIIGASPYAGLMQARDGALYGTTLFAGTRGGGTIFRITTGGRLTILHNFDNQDGINPWARLVQGSDGDLYGSTGIGGAYCSKGCGTIFKITTSGVLTTLHSFDERDGEEPLAELVQGADGDLYGTAYYGGSDNACLDGCGTVFKITTAGELTTLHNFHSTDGAWPESGLAQTSNGELCGTTSRGGSDDEGTIFSITP
jgi:uncharacterized repeat protein (TIGR03803 family)